MSNKSTISAANKDSLKYQLIYLIATSKTPLSRTDLAAKTGLSKMTISNHVADLIHIGLLSESYVESPAASSNALGRKPTWLSISSTTPCICGIWLRRVSCKMVLADISGHIIDMTHFNFPKNLTKEKLIQLLLLHYDSLVSHTKRKIIGCGISSIGPINIVTGMLTNPPDFYGITDIPLVSIFAEHTGLPTYLLHDAKAGGLAEKIYGYGKEINDYLYCHISHGIGLGFIINGKLFSGISGRAGEIGHTSIDCNGPQCSCGNVGCLELFSSVAKMQRKIKELHPFYKDSDLAKLHAPAWEDILAHALAKDPIAITALDEFCKYLAQALFNTMKLMDFSTLIVGYDPPSSSSFQIKNENLIEKMLLSKISQFQSPSPQILHSSFDGEAPLMGAIAIVTNEIFEHKIALF